MPELKLEVGHVYEARNRNRVRIICIALRGDSSYPFLGLELITKKYECPVFYAENGETIFTNDRGNLDDLIREVTE